MFLFNFAEGMIVVARWVTSAGTRWTRACIEDPDPQGEATLVRLVDYGGYWTFRNCDMRKIHSDYLTLPFQAIEVFLANILPKDGKYHLIFQNQIVLSLNA